MSRTDALDLQERLNEKDSQIEALEIERDGLQHDLDDEGKKIDILGKALVLNAKAATRWCIFASIEATIIIFGIAMWASK